MDSVVRTSRNLCYVKRGNQIIPIQWTSSDEKVQHMQRGRSADRSNRKTKNNRRSISVPKYIRQAVELPDVKVVTENLSNKEINDIMLNLERQGAIRKLKLKTLNLDKLNAICDVVQKYDEKCQLNIIGTETLDSVNHTHESTAKGECSVQFNSYYDFEAGFNWSHDLSMILNIVEGMEKTGPLDWSHEFSMLLDNNEAVETSKSPLKRESTPLKSVQKDQCNNTGDESYDWAKEYHLLFGNALPTVSSADDLDWSMEYKILFGHSLEKKEL